MKTDKVLVVLPENIAQKTGTSAFDRQGSPSILNLDSIQPQHNEAKFVSGENSKCFLQEVKVSEADREN